MTQADMTPHRPSLHPEAAVQDAAAPTLFPAGGLLAPGLIAPGLVALVSLLLALLGYSAGSGPHDRAPQASMAAPALPELRGVQVPLPQGPVLGTGEETRLPAPTPQWTVQQAMLSAPAVARRPELTVLGRRNTDGG